ncbi:MAG TPA: hypothetical protein DC054_12180 [Blastocatellia bacterium]|nr:hypothetical protein [Blastocatellia bacterium]
MVEGEGSNPKNEATASDKFDADLSMTATAAGSPALAISFTTAIVMNDAADMLRNVSTIQITAIGAATAAWIASANPVYKEIITSSISTLQEAAALYLTIGENAYKVFMQYKEQT